LDLWTPLNQIFIALVYYAVMLLMLVPLVRRYRSIHPIAAFYIGSYVIAQYLTPKLTFFLGWVVPNGNVSYVATVALMDAIVVLAGLGVAKQVIYAGFVLQILLTLSNLMVIATPTPEWIDPSAVNAFLGVSGRVAVASPIAYLAAELFNAHVTHRYRRKWWARTVYSDPLAMVIDTLIFMPIAFYGEVETRVLLDMTVGLAALKLAFIPLNLLAVYVFRKTVEGYFQQGA